MSKFTAKPYIEAVLGELSGENKAKLLNLINGKNAAGNADIEYSVCSSAEAMSSLAAGVHAIAYKYNYSIIWKGYFVKTTNYKCFITFKTGIDLELASIYKNDGERIIPMEKCTADNLRALLREDSYIDSSELPSVPTEQEIKALAKDEVEDAENGTPVNVLGLNEDGELVKGSLPSGGTKLYLHKIYYRPQNAPSQVTYNLSFISSSNNNFTSLSDFYTNLTRKEIWLAYKTTNSSYGYKLLEVKTNGDFVYIDTDFSIKSFSLSTATFVNARVEDY